MNSFLVIIISFLSLNSGLVIHTDQQRLDENLCRVVRSNDAPAVRKYLLDGANPEIKSFNGAYSLAHYCAQENYAESLEHIIAAGANINLQDTYGLSPAHHACKLGHYKTAKKCLELQADPHLLTKDDNTLLHYASSLDDSYKRHKIVELVCSYQFLPNVKNIQNQTPIDHAIIHNDQKVIAMLLACGSDFHETKNGVFLDKLRIASYNYRKSQSQIIVPSHYTRQDSNSTQEKILDDLYHDVIRIKNQKK
jgi:ankyrin repeat protein